ncbi:hypothetical protein ACLEX4_19155 [Pseudescherichia vulneris]
MLTRHLLIFLCTLSFFLIAESKAQTTEIARATSETGVTYSLSYDDSFGTYGQLIMTTSEINVHPKNQNSLAGVYIPDCFDAAMGMCMYGDARTSLTQPDEVITWANGQHKINMGSTITHTHTLVTPKQQKGVEDGKLTMCVMGIVDNNDYYHWAGPWFNAGGNIATDGACTSGTIINPIPIKPATTCTLKAPAQINHGTLSSTELNGAVQEVNVDVTCNQEADVTLSFNGQGSSTNISLTPGLTDILDFEQPKLHINTTGGTKIKSTLKSAGNISPGTYSQSLVVTAEWQ